MALSFVEQHPALDSDRIGLWGSSYSGANVLVAAAMDRRVKAVVSQVHFISGYDQFVLGSGQDALAAIRHNMDNDRQSRLNGEEPGRIALVRMPTDPADQAVLFEDPADYEYLVGGPEGPADGWINSVPPPIDRTSAGVRRASVHAPHQPDASDDDRRRRRPDHAAFARTGGLRCGA